MLKLKLIELMLILSTFLVFFNVLLMIFKVPSIKDKNRIRSAFSKGNKISFSLELAMNLSKFIKLSTERKNDLKIKLASSGIKLSPETFIALAVVKSSIAFLIAILLMFLATIIKASGIISILMVMLIFLFFILAILKYSSSVKEVDDILKAKREAIEWELPRFVEAITNELSLNKDLIKIFENYSKSAGEMFLEELEITIADMKMGNIERALHKLDKRVGLPSLSQVIRGLISLNSGEDNDFYFKMLSYELGQIRYQKLKKVALKRPRKIRRMNLLILFSFLSLYIVVFGLEIIDKISVFK